MARRRDRLPRHPQIRCGMGALRPIRPTRLCGFRSAICVLLTYEMRFNTLQLMCGDAPSRPPSLPVRLELLYSRCGLDVQETTATGNRKKKKRTALNQIGTRVRVNELDVTLFRIGAILFATQEACQHMGGPLSLGDIEVRVLDQHHLVTRQPECSTAPHSCCPSPGAGRRWICMSCVP